jgi:hypothetical protein
MRTTTIQFATAATASARITQLQAQLGLPLTAAPQTIEQSWDLIEELETQLAAKGDLVVATPAKATPAKVAPAIAKVTAAKPELFGIQRAAAALREGRTATPTASTVPLTGVMRAAAAQEKINARRNKS